MASSSGKPLSYEMTAAAKHPKSCTLLSLKDYLRDDLSSCSSSGFMSFPRRQCCLQVQPPSPAKSVLRKALEAVFNAIKFGRCKAKKRVVAVPSRSFHPNLLNRSFWKRAFNGTLGNSVNCNSASDSVISCSLNHAGMMEGSVTTTNTCSVVTNAATVESRGKQDWTNEKEQFSPVSVLDCPIFDDDEDITSPFNSPSCSTLQVPKHKHIQKSPRSLKPLELDKNVLWSELQEHEPIYNHPTKPCQLLLSITCTQNGNIDMFHDNGNVEENALNLLTHVKNSIPSVSLKFEVENLLFDFFKESIWENFDIKNYSIKHHFCKMAEDWIRGQPHEQYEYSSLQTLMEMDKCGSLTTFDQEIQQLVMEMELEFSTTLVNELLVDLNMCYF